MNEIVKLYPLVNSAVDIIKISCSSYFCAGNGFAIVTDPTIYSDYYDDNEIAVVYTEPKTNR